MQGAYTWQDRFPSMRYRLPASCSAMSMPSYLCRYMTSGEILSLSQTLSLCNHQSWHSACIHGKLEVFSFLLLSASEIIEPIGQVLTQTYQEISFRRSELARRNKWQSKRYVSLKVRCLRDFDNTKNSPQVHRHLGRCAYAISTKSCHSYYMDSAML